MTATETAQHYVLRAGSRVAQEGTLKRGVLRELVIDGGVDGGLAWARVLWDGETRVHLVDPEILRPETQTPEERPDRFFEALPRRPDGHIHEAWCSWLHPCSCGSGEVAIRPDTAQLPRGSTPCTHPAKSLRGIRGGHDWCSDCGSFDHSQFGWMVPKRVLSPSEPGPGSLEGILAKRDVPLTPSVFEAMCDAYDLGRHVEREEQKKNETSSALLLEEVFTAVREETDGCSILKGDVRSPIRRAIARAREAATPKTAVAGDREALRAVLTLLNDGDRDGRYALGEMTRILETALARSSSETALPTQASSANERPHGRSHDPACQCPVCRDDLLEPGGGAKVTKEWVERLETLIERWRVTDDGTDQEREVERQIRAMWLRTETASNGLRVLAEAVLFPRRCEPAIPITVRMLAARVVGAPCPCGMCAECLGSTDEKGEDR